MKSHWPLSGRILPVVGLLAALGATACVASGAPGAGPKGSASGTAEKPDAPLSPPVDVKVGGTVFASDAGIYIAYERGYFRDQGLNVEVEVFTGGAADMVPALATGQLAVAAGSPGVGLYNAMQRDIPIKIVADKGNLSPGHGYQGLMVRKDLVDSGEVKTYSDLKGRTIGIGAYGTSADLLVNRALSLGGVAKSDVKFVTMGNPDLNAALANKAIDAALFAEPLVTVAVERGIAVKFKGADEIYPNHQVGVIMYSPQFAENKEAANRFMVAYIRGARDYVDAFDKNKGKENIITILTKYTSVKEAEIYQRMIPPGLNPDGYVNSQGIAADLDWYASQGQVPVKPDLSKMIDNQYVEYALRKLGKYQ